MTTLNENQERALEVSHFLTTFSSFVSAPGESETGPVSPRDVESGLEFRYMLQRHHELENEAGARRQDGVSKEEELGKLDQALESSRKALDATPATAKEVHDMLRRLEVRSAKAIAQQVLVHCGPVPRSSSLNTNKRWVCSSPLLNIPGPMYFSKILPMIAAQDDQARSVGQPRMRLSFKETHPSSTISPPPHSCTMALPPNAWTWEEYARIANMVVLLPTAEARAEVLKSTMSGAVPTVMPMRDKKSAKDDLKLSENAEINKTDLVALWVRAQRNVGALMHLLHLFEVAQVKRDSEKNGQNRQQWRVAKGRGVGGKVLIPQPDDEDESDDEENPLNDMHDPVESMHLEARFFGNHKWSRKVVQEVAPLMDDIVDWAVTNQFLFTNPYIRLMLRNGMSKMSMGKDHKRPYESQPDTDTLHVPSCKRTKASSSGPDTLLFACQAYVLRWLARRHRESLLPVFSSAPTDYAGANRSSRKEIEGKVCCYISKRQGKDMAGNRTLSRIDRRTLKGAFATECAPSFQDAVSVLLAALEDAQVCSKAVLDDFKSLNGTFLEGKDGTSAASALLDAHGESGEGDCALLVSVPTPWIDRCSACSKSFDTSDPVVCDFCELAVHEGCDSKIEARKISELIALYPPLTGLFPSIVPLGLSRPDFRKGVSWKSVDMQVKGRSGRPIGVKVRQTEVCESIMSRFESGIATAGELVVESCPIYPLAVPHRGLLVIEVDPSSPSARTGLRSNDIITAIRFDTNDTNGMASPWHDFRDFSADERLALMTRDVTSVVLRVQRPDIDLTRKSQRWLGRLRETNRKTPRSVSRKRKLRCCSKCQLGVGRAKSSTRQSQGDRVKREAIWCRAVIRRLGMESFSLPFHEESLTEVSETSTHDLDGFQHPHDQFVSLRRLDSMLCAIASQRKEGASPFVGSPFLVPSLVRGPASEESDKRLAWAPRRLESKPMELLCIAIRLLVASPGHGRKDMFAKQKIQLRDHFISLFTAWCVSDLKGIIGPPLYALYSRPPWRTMSCAVCFARPVTRVCSTDGDLYEICENRFCDERITTASKPEGLPITSTFNSGDDAPQQDDPLASGLLCTFDQCSSLVGTFLVALPGDPVVGLLSSTLNKAVETMNRPVAFIIASFIPRGFAGGPDSKQKRIDGIFHVLPVLSADQLRSLLKNCKMRAPPVTDALDCRTWTALDILQIQGVLQMTPPEIESLQHRSCAILEAIQVQISRVTSTFVPIALQKVAASKRTTTTHCVGTISSFPCMGLRNESTFLQGDPLVPAIQGDHWKKCSVDLARQSLLIEHMSACESPFLHDMVSDLQISDVVIANGERKENTKSGLVDTGTVFAEADEVDQLIGSLPKRRGQLCSSNMDSGINADVELYIKSLRESLPGSSSIPRVTYTDLVGPTVQETRRIHRLIQDQKLISPIALDISSTHTILLDRGAFVNRGDRCETDFSGRGWGFEILDWDEDGIVRVGRVHPNSPASIAGLEANDRIENIAGMSLSDSCSRSHLVSALLHTTFFECKKLSECLMLAKAPKNAPSVLVLTVSRGADSLAEGSPYAVANLTERQVVDITDTDEETLFGDSSPMISGVVERTPRLSAQRLPPAARQRPWSDEVVSPSDLYMPGRLNTVLTQIETSVLYEAFVRNQPLLGRRLLVPRYDWLKTDDFLQEVMKATSSHVSIMRLEGDLWAYILKGDFARRQSESGQPCIGRECGFHYSLPNQPLPLDRIAESYFGCRSHSPKRKNALQSSLDSQSTLTGLAGSPYEGRKPNSAARGLTRPTASERVAWIGKLVRSRCTIRRDGAKEDPSYLVGRVLDYSDELVTVDVFFIGSEGYLSESCIRHLSPSDLIPVTRDDPGMTLIILGWLARSPLCDHGNLDFCEATSLTIRECGLSLLKCLSDRTCRMIPLGLLPDDSAVYWARSDPCALYLRCSDTLSELAHARTRTLFDHDPLGHRASDSVGFFCPWGCSNSPRAKNDHTNDRRVRIMPFSRSDDLSSHLSTSHWAAMGGNLVEGFMRVNEGPQILSLAADLTNAACARCPALVDFTKELEEFNQVYGGKKAGMRRFSSHVLCLTSTGQGAPRSLGPLLDCRRGSKSAIVRLLLLWSKLARLFDVERSGLFRFKSEACLPIPALDGEDAAPGERQLAEGVSTACFRGRQTQEPFAAESLSCPLCCWPGEKSIECFIKSNTQPGLDDGRPIGCALYSKVCFPQQTSTNQMTPHNLEAGGIGASKAVLIYFSSFVPLSLRDDGESARESLWEEDNFINWRKQVEQAHTLRALAQAYSVLLRFVDTSTLPGWWTDTNSGWHSSAAIHRISSLPALLLHLFVFDLALTEHISSTDSSNDVSRPIEKQTPDGLSDVTVEDRMSTVLSFADGIGYSRFDGVSSSFCVQCDDGGVLLECEFCENVQHPGCSNPPIEDPSNISGWVCDSCIADLWKMKETSSS